MKSLFLLGFLKPRLLADEQICIQCLHVQFKNIERSVPAIERIEPFSFEVAIIIPGHDQQRLLSLTNAHQLQIPATIARNIQRKCEYWPGKISHSHQGVLNISGAKEILTKIYHLIHLPWLSTLFMIDSGDKGTVSSLRFE